MAAKPFCDSRGLVERRGERERGLFGPRLLMQLEADSGGIRSWNDVGGE